MSKSVATYWKVVVNNVNLSTFSEGVKIADSKDKIDTSGFGGSKEYIPGQADASIDVDMFFGQGSNEPHTVIYPLYLGGSTFPIYVQANSQSGTSSSNQLYGGTASIYEYPVEASLGDAVKYTLSFSPAPNSSFTWGTVAP